MGMSPVLVGHCHNRDVKLSRPWACVALTGFLALVSGMPAAERLPVRVLTAAQGLSADNVTCLYQDRDGRLWIGTAVGLSRYDGYRFVSYGVRDGLPHPVISEVTQTPDGTIWIATPGGLVRLLKTRRAGKLFELVPLGREGSRHTVRSLTVDGAGTLWVAAGEQLWQKTANGPFERIPLGVHWIEGHARAVILVRASPDGSVWVGTSAGLYRRCPDGRIVRYPPAPDDRFPTVKCLEVAPSGTVWLHLNTVGIVLLSPAPPAGARGYCLSREAPETATVPNGPLAPGTAVLLGAKAGFQSDAVTGIAFGTAGEVYIASYRRGVSVVRNGSVQRLGISAGLPEEQFLAVLVDRTGILWLGSASKGLVRIAPGGFTSFTTADGLATASVASVFRGPDGRVMVDGFPPGTALHRLRGERFEAVHPPIPQPASRGSWGLSQVSLQDHRGRWWIPTTRGLYLFPAVRRWADLGTVRPEAVYHAADGLGGEEVFRLFEDSRGDIWAGVFGDHSVVRWDHRSRRWTGYGPEAGLPKASATSFAEDRSGAVWIGFYNGGIARFRAGRFELFGTTEGFPPGFVFVLHVDGEGRLWAGTTHGGVGRLDDPTEPHPRWRRYTAEQGLSSEGVLALVDDGRGHLFVGSMRGIDRLDVSSGAVVHLDTRDGLAANSVISACRDEGGNLWFGTGGGVSRLRPRSNPSIVVPPALIQGVSVGGEPVALPELGTRTMGPLRCPVGTRSVEVHFGAISLREGQRLRYSFHLGPSDTAWSPASPGGTVHLEGLAPARYLLRLRAELADGSHGPEARLRFLIPPPLWRRWWFQGGLLLLGLALVVQWHRARIRRLMEVQRVRERIASDLHDELGLSLSRISILSEVVRRDAEERGAPSWELENIGETARSLMDATSDMAWALDPSKDNLGSVLARIRRLAGDVCEASGVNLEVLVEEDLKALRLTSEVRRHILLILKEAIHNALRHGDPSRITLRAYRSSGFLELRLEDDGTGFDPASPVVAGKEGHGLSSMARRAREAGGTLEIVSKPANGTSVTISFPLSRNGIPA